jgi:PIN domain nuclease of toxin-antitoxin system
VRLLLDTHVWLWLQTTPDRIVGDVLDDLRDPATTLLLSAASSWEISIKHALGKLDLPQPPARYVPERLRTSRVDALPITVAHTLVAGELPAHHNDPFDRLLIAQAISEDLALVTVDRALESYEAPLRWA